MVGNVVGNILGKRTGRDRYSRNMAIEPEKFKTKFEKWERSPNPIGKGFMNVADELDDQQIAGITAAYKQKREADEALKPYGLAGREGQDPWLNMRLRSIEIERQHGERKEKNPRK